MDNELLELCKEVYKRTGWDDKSAKRRFVTREIVDDADLGGNTASYYTSYYLLEKLPYYINTHDVRGSFEFFLKKTYNEYHAGYNKPELGKWLDDNNHAVWEKVMHADTPLKALLKLVIALDNAGQLKGDK